jgi:hypothetical protein
MSALEDAVRARAITEVVHFTRIENLQAILQNGIVPKRILQNRGAVVVSNDAYRLDGQLDASCVSIEHPNYKMFYRLRTSNPGTEWAVVICDSKLIWEKDCAFCIENAASGSVTATPIDQRKTVAAFEAMFGEYPDKPLRAQLRHSPKDTTNPQAEILVFGEIEPAYIQRVAYQKIDTMQRFTAAFPHVGATLNGKYFNYRHDWQHWKQ